ncbi:MAG: alpha/beta hydrolase fold protein [Frankiales bacterium]|nr:alpha/beta hydrolase fold protein [Frankiales bacterium]
MTAPARRPLLLLLLLWLANQVRWARATRPEPLPAPPAGSREVVLSDGTRLHAQVGGVPTSDTTVVLVHGFLARTLEFDMQWNHLGNDVRLVRYDHRHHGRSGHAPRVLDVADLADDLAEVVAQTTPTGRVVLVGHSMGGMTVLALADRHPDLFRTRVAGVALVSTGAGHQLDGHPVEDALRWAGRHRLLAGGLFGFRVLAPLLEQLRPRRTRVLRRLTRAVMFGTDDVDPATLAMTQDLLEGPPLSTLGALQGALLRHDVLRVLPRLAGTPVVVVTGGEDRLVRPEHSARMVEDIGPSAELVVVPGAGHVVNQTRPVEVNAALDRLLARVGREARAAA